MSFFKAVAVFLVAAIANPLCCCVAALAQTAATTPEPAASQNACCAAESEAGESQSDASGHHDAADCSHKADKESQISQTADAHDQQVKPSLNVVAHLAALPELRADAPVARFAERSLDGRPLPPDASLAQVYCVYLL